jgi:hypothetical protein
VLREFHRTLQPVGRVLFSAHEGQGEVERDQFLEDPVPFVATFFELDELVDASRAAGLTVSLAERRARNSAACRGMTAAATGSSRQDPGGHLGECLGAHAVRASPSAGVPVW